VDGPWALDGVDLELSPGRRIAVIGASGAGKSTLAAVLTRLLAYQAGTITLAGVEPSRVELADLEGDDVRRIVGLVEQDAHVFDTSLRENLQLARRDATEGELRDALRRARLLDWVETLPLGLDTAVGEHGAQLSGGQRQRLALARALVADFPILVLDEPGEHLDTATADAVTADIVAVTEARSTLLITHRLTGLVTMDEVIVLDAGRVVEQGTHTDLVAAGGRYARLWRHQQEETP
jgi:ABC-type multidrug transport system fused ATPase/permease subunit